MEEVCQWTVLDRAYLESRECKRALARFSNHEPHHRDRILLSLFISVEHGIIA